MAFMCNGRELPLSRDDVMVTRWRLLPALRAGTMYETSEPEIGVFHQPRDLEEQSYRASWLRGTGRRRGADRCPAGRASGGAGSAYLGPGLISVGGHDWEDFP